MRIEIWPEGALFVRVDDLQRHQCLIALRSIAREIVHRYERIDEDAIASSEPRRVGRRLQRVRLAAAVEEIL